MTVSVMFPLFLFLMTSSLHHSVAGGKVRVRLLEGGRILYTPLEMWWVFKHTRKNQMSLIHILI